jgi:hypothetical protein
MLARLGPRGGGGPALLKQIEDSARCVWSPAYGDLRVHEGACFGDQARVGDQAVLAAGRMASKRAEV